MFGRIWCMVVKEFIQLRRDRYVRVRLIVPPLVQMLVFGYAATFEVKHLPIAVLDLDHSQASRDLLSRFTFTGRFRIAAVLSNERELKALIGHSTIPMALTIEPGFAALVRKGRTAHLQAIVDGTNSNTALIAVGYINQIAAQFSQDYARARIERLAPPVAAQVPQISLQQRPWYNPGMSSPWFFVPGLIGTITMMLVVNLTAFGIVREREIGTLEQVLVTPIRPVELMLGKTIPFFLVGLADVALITSVGTLWFRVPFRGNPLVLLLGTVLFLLCTLSVGLLISTLCSTQQQAFASGFFFLNPAFILSGFSFPISSMPRAMQLLTYLGPLRYFLVIVRGTFLKGVGLRVLWPQMLALAGLTAILLTVSVLRFRKSLD
ncbi:MAG TPA: ABC transporter permease [Candidatus Acidoferrales bacterium]|nr:ABC transporter permease [Candidatus Acidoferrales bacterium]